MKLLNFLKEKNKTISTCESCTGGLLGSILTDFPGSSKFYKGGFITYTNEMKSKDRLSRNGENQIVGINCAFHCVNFICYH